MTDEKLSTNEKVRRLIIAGYSNKYIIDTLRVNPQIVYNARYKINKSRGLGALAQGTNISSPEPESYTVYNKLPEPMQLPELYVPKRPVWVRVLDWVTHLFRRGQYG